MRFVWESRKEIKSRQIETKSRQNRDKVKTKSRQNQDKIKTKHLRLKTLNKIKLKLDVYDKVLVKTLKRIELPTIWSIWSIYSEKFSSEIFVGP